MGDAFLAVWPEEGAAAGAAALAALKRDIDAWWAARSWDSRVVIKAHFGRAVAGPFGRDGRYDVIGTEVNVAAILPARTVSLSAEAFRCLENGERRAGTRSTPRRWSTSRWTIPDREPAGRGRAPGAARLL